MRRLAVALTCLLVAMPATAKINSELIEGEEDLYFVEFQRGDLLRGVWYQDNPKKNERKLLKAIPEVCLEEGFAYYHVVTTREIAESEKLKNYWQEWAGGERTSERLDDDTGIVFFYTYWTKRLVRFAQEEGESFKKCGK